MISPPRRLVRRLLLTPIVFVGALVLGILSPAIHLVAAVADLVFDRRRWRISRFVGVGLAFCVVEVVSLCSLLITWVGSGFGRFSHRPRWVEANTQITGRHLALITHAVRFYLGFSFTYTNEPIPTGPVLLLARHAGPGDAFLIGRVIIRDGGRRLRIVGSEKLTWDPFLDIAGYRLGFHYLHAERPGDPTNTDQIRDLAEELTDGDVLVIFPEGGNYTHRRKQRLLSSLRDRGEHELADRAERLRHTLLPRPGGVLAALEGCPQLSVLFAAHAGLDALHGFTDLWNAVPLNKEVTAHAWVTATDSRPTDAAGQTMWLCDQWEAVDDWIDDELARTQPSNDTPPQGH